MDMEGKDNLFETVAAILLRCFFLSLVLVYFWFGFYLLSGDLGHAIHSKFFACSRHDYDLLNYFGIAFTKIFAIVFFLIPYLSIKWVLRSGRMKN